MGYIFGLLSAVLFAANGSAIKVLVETGITPAQITFFRVAGVAVISGIVLLFTNRSAFRLSLRSLGVMMVLGLTGIAMMQWFYATALSLVPVGIALLLEFMAIILVAMIAWGIFREQVKARLWWAIACVIVGLAFVAQIWSVTLNPLGVTMGLLAAVSLTIFLVLGERLVAQTSALTVAFWSMFFAAGFWAIFSQWWQIPLKAFQAEISLSGTLSNVALPMWLPLLWSIVLGSFLPFFFAFLALKHLTATVASVISSSEVVFAFIVAWLWLGETLELNQIIGITIVMVGIVLAQTARVHKLLGADEVTEEVLTATGAIPVIDVRPSELVDEPE